MASTLDRAVGAARPAIALEPPADDRPRGAAQRWAAAAFFGAGALAATLLLRNYLGQTIFVLFFGAVALTARYSGFRHSVAVMVGGLIATNYLLMGEDNQFALDVQSATSMGLIMLTGLLIGWLMNALTEARATLADQMEQLQTQAVELEAQYDESQMLTEELETSNTELEEAYDRAQSANRAKNDFLAVMSHELRTPLNAIVGYADLLQTGVSGPLTDTQRTHLSRIRSSSFHLLDLIQDVLSFSRIEAGREELRIADVEVEQMARDAFNYIEQECIAKGIDARISLPSERLVMVTDPAKVRQILLNLLNNACKFTDHGFVELKIERVRDDIAFRVRDTGPGIAREYVEMIFEPFTQVDQSTTRIKGGAGLGLPVSRRLAHLLGGSLEVDSTPGAGSTFTLQLPIRARLG